MARAARKMPTKRRVHTHTNDALSPIIIGTNRSLLHKLLTEAQSVASPLGLSRFVSRNQ